LGFVLENIARLAYGNTARSFAIELARPFRFLDIRMNREQMIIIGVSTLAMIAMYVLLTRMPIGRAMRAVSDNPALALVRGIESPRIIRWTWFIAGMLLAIGGVLIGMDRALEPPMGSSYLIAVFAAAILGGLGSPLGAFVGALIIGIVSELSTLVIPPNYRIGIPLCVIALILVFRPQGLFGQPYIRK
jgi:branched-subunit amino acid ABC-type transport system permease component